MASTEYQIGFFRKLFEFSPTPVALFDRQGYCRLANRAFLLQMGYEPDADILGELQLTDLFIKPTQMDLLVAEITDRGAVPRQEARLRTRDGAEITVLLSGRKLQFEGADWIEWSFIGIDPMKRVERGLRRQYRRLSALIEDLTAGVFLVNNRGYITDANLALGNILQLSPKDMIRRPYRSLFSHLLSMVNEPEVLQRELSRAVLRIAERPVIEFALKDEQLKVLELSLFPVRGENGRPLGWGGLVNDVTDMRAQTAWKLDQLSRISHDIISPLATLKGHATALLASHDHWDSALVTEFLEAINHGLDQMAHHVEQSIALTRIEAGHLGLRPEAADPKLLVKYALERAAGKLENHPITQEFGSDLPAVRVDPGRLEEVLVNLIENAARYSPQTEPIHIRIHAEEGRVSFSIVDHGPGIPPERQPTIFEPYERPEAEGGGTGLGLFISHRIIQAHSGQLRLRSPLSDTQSGAAFTISLPAMTDVVVDEPPQTALEVFDSQLELESSGERILVVADDADFQLLMRSILLEEGYQVEVAPDGSTALDMIRVSPPSLVLLDRFFPGISGLQICRSIRRISSVPVILLTSETAQEDLVAAFDVGVDDYLTTPFGSEELLVRIRALLRRGRGSERDARPESYYSGGLMIDYDMRYAWLDGERLNLTVKEFDLLAYLSRHPHRVLTYDLLMDELWPGGETSRHTLFVHISRLRKKIEKDPKDPRFIETRWGVGYLFLQRGA
jgi:PAS domain S-box-containing protein